MAHRHQFFIGSSFVGPGHGAITLRGDMDAHAVDQLTEHLDGFLDAATRFITIDAVEVRSAIPRVIGLLGHTQHRLAAHGGALRVVGLHPSSLAAAPAASPAPAEVAEGVRREHAPG